VSPAGPPPLPYRASLGPAATFVVIGTPPTFCREVYVRTGGDEGLFVVYSDIQFRTPVSAGDVLEVPDLAFEAG